MTKFPFLTLNMSILYCFRGACENGVCLSFCERRGLLDCQCEDCKYRVITSAKKVMFLSVFIMSTPLGGGHIIFAFSAVRHPSSRCLVSVHF